MADRFKDSQDPNTIKRSMHPAQARREALKMASETLEKAGLGSLTEDNIRPKQPHSEPTYFSKPPANSFPLNPLRVFARKSPEPETPSSSGKTRSYTAADVRTSRQKLAKEEDERTRDPESPTNTLGLVAAGSAAAGVATSALIGSTLLPALIITAGVTGLFVGYQYFTKTGLFKEPSPLMPDEGSMLMRSATPGQEMQAMIDSEKNRLQAERAQMGQTTAIVSPEIEVPQTPKVAKTDARQGMQPPPGNKGLS